MVKRFLSSFATVWLIIGVITYQCTGSAIEDVGKYFWYNVTAQYKEQWEAKAVNGEHSNGFWEFAFAFHETMYTEDFSIYTEMWNNLTPEARLIWTSPSDTVIEDELECIPMDPFNYQPYWCSPGKYLWWVYDFCKYLILNKFDKNKRIKNITFPLIRVKQVLGYGMPLEL